ncbi:MAG: OmpA family protein [Candidatus Sedimenticola sp. (ex Thyasira tokunagai)]
MKNNPSILPEPDRVKLRLEGPRRIASFISTLSLIVISTIIVAIAVFSTFVEVDIEAHDLENLEKQGYAVQEIFGKGSTRISAKGDKLTIKLASKPSNSKKYSTNMNIRNSVSFNFDAYTLTDSMKVKLRKLVSILSDRNRVRVLGHTDADGEVEYNMDLSILRAYSVYRFLSNIGVNGYSMTLEGFGEKFPISSNSTPLGRQDNRRVELEVSMVSNPSSNKDQHNMPNYVVRIVAFIEKNPWAIILVFASAAISLAAYLVRSTMFIAVFLMRRMEDSNNPA